ncbi:MAG: glycosyltransferase [Oscillospiraceae bacterium]|nr:glycosyltransferase [Oscillospiraceae bacterium]
MKITIVAMGSRGDIQPYVALGKELKKLGHEIHMPVPEVFKEMVLDAKLNYTPIYGIDPVAFLKRKELVEAREKKNGLSFLAKLFSDMKPLAELYFKQIMEACKGSDAIISAFIYLGAYDIAEKLNIPCIQSVLYPLYPTVEFPSIILPFSNKNKFFYLFNITTHLILGELVWLATSKWTNKIRREYLGLKPYGFFGPYLKQLKDRAPVLFAFSPHVIKKPHDWFKNWIVTGYFFNDDIENYTPPEDLVSFIKSGSKPIYIGFGSMIDDNPIKTTEMILEAIKLSGVRAIVSAGWTDLGKDKLPDSVFLVKDVPHSWLFKNVQTTITHGGAGTAAASMRAGVPTIITPFLGDQFYWGKHLYKLGVSPKPVDFNKLNAINLSNLIKTAINDENMKQKAKELGKLISSENGTQKAAKIVDGYFKSYYLNPIESDIILDDMKNRYIENISRV